MGHIVYRFRRYERPQSEGAAAIYSRGKKEQRSKIENLATIRRPFTRLLVLALTPEEYNGLVFLVL